MTVYWRQTAIKIIYGFNKTFFTCEKFKVIPIPNITIPKNTGMKSLNKIKEFGKTNPNIKKKIIKRTKLNLERIIKTIDHSLSKVF